MKSMRSLSRRIWFPLLLVTSIQLCPPSLAQDDFSFDGYVATTATTVYKALHPEIFYHAKVEVQYKVNKMMEAQLELKGQSNEGERIRFREANIRVKLGKEDKIKVGNMKKLVGEEEMYSEEDLVTIDRTYIYTYISPMNHVGRDIGVQYVHESKESDLDYSIGAYMNNSRTFAAVGRISSAALLSSTTLAASAVIQNQQLDEGTSVATVLGNLSASHNDKAFYWNVEGFAGIDPFASRFRQLEEGSTKARVWLAGGKAVGSYFFRFDDEDHRGIEPVFLTGYLVPDTRNSKVYTLELLVGVNYYFDKHTRLRLNIHPLLTANGVNNEFSQVGSSAILEFQLRW